MSINEVFHEDSFVETLSKQAVDGTTRKVHREDGIRVATKAETRVGIKEEEQEVAAAVKELPRLRIIIRRQAFGQPIRVTKAVGMITKVAVVAMVVTQVVTQVAGLILRVVTPQAAGTIRPLTRVCPPTVLIIVFNRIRHNNFT